LQRDWEDKGNFNGKDMRTKSTIIVAILIQPTDIMECPPVKDFRVLGSLKVNSKTEKSKTPIL
jgi:hypothetical protein